MWLLRDVPALMRLLASFWTRVILAMTRSVALTRGAKAFRDHFTLLLALGEARLDNALYRRIGWHTRGVPLQILPPTTAWADTQARLLNYAHAFRNMNQIVDAYVDHIRERFGISQRKAANAGRCPPPSRHASHLPHAGHGGGKQRCARLRATEGAVTAAADRLGKQTL